MITHNVNPPALVMCRAELEALLAFASQDETRPNLGVTIRKDGAFSTDGAILLAGMFAKPLAIEGLMVVNRYSLERLLLAVPKGGGVRFIFNPAVMENDEIELIVAKDLAHPGAWEKSKPFLWALVPIARDASAPPFEAVIGDEPKRYPKSTPGFDGALLSKIEAIHHAALASGKSKDARVKFHPGDGNQETRSPMRLEWKGFGQSWIALVMPLKD